MEDLRERLGSRGHHTRLYLQGSGTLDKRTSRQGFGYQTAALASRPDSSIARHDVKSGRKICDSARRFGRSAHITLRDRKVTYSVCRKIQRTCHAVKRRGRALHPGRQEDRRAAWSGCFEMRFELRSREYTTMRNHVRTCAFAFIGANVSFKSHSHG